MANFGDIAADKANNSANGLVELDGTGALPALDGSALTGLPSGFSDPMTTRGDIIYRNAANATARLGIGANGTVLTSDGTDLLYATPTGGSGVSIGLIKAQIIGNV